MKILIMSETGDGLGIAQFMKHILGWDVEIWIKKQRYSQAAAGIIPRSSNWKLSAKQADLVIADMVGMSKTVGPQLEKFGVTHMGFTAGGDILELDRHRQMDVLERSGISIPQTWRFNEPGELDGILELWQGNEGKPSWPGYVVKPSGNIETGKTYVCETLRQLEWARTQYGARQELIVQKKINGIEISTEGWFDGERWFGWNHTFEEKRLAAGSVGPNTGCMGNVVVAVDEPDLLCQEIMKLTTVLEALKYRGPVDMNCIIDSKGEIYALELTMRFGYDAIECFMPMIGEGFGEFLINIAIGNGQDPKFQKAVGCAVRVVTEPYPFNEPDENLRNLPVEFPLELSPHMYLTDCKLLSMMDDEPQYGYSASDGVVLKAVATNTLEGLPQAITQARARAASVKMQSSYFRNDIGARVADDLRTLQGLGVI